MSEKLLPSAHSELLIELLKELVRQLKEQPEKLPVLDPTSSPTHVRKPSRVSILSVFFILLCMDFFIIRVCIGFL